MEKEQSNQEKRTQLEAGKPFKILNQKHSNLNKYRLYIHTDDGGQVLWIERISFLGRWEHHCQLDSISDYFFIGWVLLLGELKSVSISFDNIEFEAEENDYSRDTDIAELTKSQSE